MLLAYRPYTQCYFLHFLLAFVKYESYDFVWDELNVSDF